MRFSLASVGLLAALAAGGMAQGASEGAARPRALLSYVAVGGGLCAMQANGSLPRRLTPAWRLHEPAWSPSGRYVAFSRETVTGPERSNIFVADARGRIRWRFGAGDRSNGLPLWSPDGRHIAYVASWAHVGALMVARSDGSDEHSIASTPAFPTYGPTNPAWSPDARRLAFDDGDDLTAPQGVFSVRADGSDRRLVVRHAVQPAYSPDGTKLAYVAREEVRMGGVFIANADGSDPHAVSSAPGAMWPAWSPDGRLLAFVRGSAVVVAKADGSGEQIIAAVGSSRIFWSPPRWSPGGKVVAFAEGPATMLGDRRFRSSIVVARADGAGRRVVVRRFSKTGVEAPAWRAAVALPPDRRAACPRR